MQQQPRQIHWRQVQGNPYLQSLHPDMLTSTGYLIVKQDRTIGMSKFEEKVSVQILFDREYVIEFVIRKLLKTLLVKDYNQFQQLMSDIWKVYKTANKADKP